MRRSRMFLAAGLLACLFIAGVASFYASSRPDGLERVAADQGFEDTARTSPLSGGPFAGYATRGIRDARLSGGLAGVAGVGLTLVLAGGLFLVLGRCGRRTPDTAGADAMGGTGCDGSTPPLGPQP